MEEGKFTPAQTSNAMLGVILIAVVLAVVALMRGGHDQRQQNLAELTDAVTPKEHAASAPRKAMKDQAASPDIPAQALFVTKLAHEFAKEVEFTVVCSKSTEELETALDEIVSAYGGAYDFQSVQDEKWVYARNNAPDQLVVGVVATATMVTVTFKANPTPEQLTTVTKPVRLLASALGLPTQGTWSGNDSTRKFTLRNPAELPPGKMM